MQNVEVAIREAKNSPQKECQRLTTTINTIIAQIIAYCFYLSWPDYCFKSFFVLVGEDIRFSYVLMDEFSQNFPCLGILKSLETVKSFYSVPQTLAALELLALEVSGCFALSSCLST